MFFRKERNLSNKPSGSELGFPGPISIQTGLLDVQLLQYFLKAFVYLPW